MAKTNKHSEGWILQTARVVYKLAHKCKLESAIISMACDNS